MSAKRLVPAGSTWVGLLLAMLLSSATALGEVIDIQEDTGPAGLTLVSQKASGVEIHFGMEQFSLSPVVVDGQTLQAVSLPGVFLPNDAGAPDLPGIGRFIAIPEGATVSVEITSSRTMTMKDVAVAPAPVLPRENDDSPPVYEPDPAIYGMDAYYPANPVTLSERRSIRGVDAVIAGITPFQYNPVTRELVVYTELSVRIDFQGGRGTFGETRLRSRYWEPLLEAQLLNYASLPALEPELPRQEGDGCDYMIICPDNPDFIAWADTLRSWRTLQGIDTEVFTTAVTGTTTAQIEAFINNAYNTWNPVPAAFLILGDYPSSGMRDTGITSPIWNSYCASDNIYADVDGDDLPEFAHARICARDAAELQRMIGKMLSYERQPYTDPAFYANPVIAGGWQDERWFILCCEVCLGFCQNVLGQTPRREYAIYQGNPGALWSTNANTYMVVNYFGPNGLGYIPATPQHLTDWGGNATRINSDINAGAYMVVHRDHGLEESWGEPLYTTTSLDGLTNDKYPFVFSVNCLTGRYNWSGECFSEKFHRIEHGALGLTCASQISYSFVNDAFFWGMFDGMWPQFDPGYGANEIGSTDVRPSFAMSYGKYYLEASNWPYNPGDKVYTYHLFHQFGDAFITMYTAVPQNLTVVHDGVLFTDTDTYPVQADAGAVIALSVDGTLIGVAEATGYPQDIPIVPQAEPGELRLVVTKANYFRHDERVSIVPPAGPYLLIGDRTVDDDLLDESAGNGDGGPDAGETVELVLGLRNVGTETATNVRAILATDDPHVVVTDSTETYGDIGVGLSVLCAEDFDFTVSSACPDGQVVSFTLTADSDNRMSWEKRFTVEVGAPELALLSYRIDDTAGGDGDGRVEPGETVALTPLLANSGTESATNVSLHLHVHSPDVTILNGQAAVPLVPSGGQAEPAAGFEFSIAPDCPEPEILTGRLVVNADWGQNALLEFTLPVGGFFDDVESGAGAWLHYVVSAGFADQWHLSTTRNYTPGGATSWKFGDPGAGDYANLSDGALESEPLPLRDRCFLRFRHWMEAEVSGAHPGYCYDGGMVEMSVNGGAWEPIAPTGGYPYRIRPGGTPGPWPAETPVYSGNVDWAPAVFEISGLAGEARFRFRFGSDGADVREGWYLDEVEWSGMSLDPQESGEWSPVVLHPALEQNRPNPFRPRTVIAYRLTERGRVTLAIYDSAGRAVRSLVDGESSPGVHYVTWDGCDDGGAPVGSGVYFYRFEGEGISQTRKMILAR